MKPDCREINKAISSYHDCAPGDHAAAWNVFDFDFDLIYFIWRGCGGVKGRREGGNE